MRTRATTSSQRRRPQLPGILATTLDTWRPWKLGTSGAGTESGCETKLELPQRESLGLMNGPWGHLGASKVFGMGKGRWRGWNLACTVCRKLPLDRKVIFLPLFRQHWPQSDLRRGTMFPSSVWPPAVCGGLFKGLVKCPGWSFKQPTNADSILGTRRSPSLQAPAGGTSAFPSREQKNEKRPSHNPASQPKFLVFEGLMKGSQGGSGCSWRQQATGRGRSRFAFSQGAPRQPAGPLLRTRPAGRAVAERRTCLCRRSCGLICVEQWGSLGD